MCTHPIKVKSCGVRGVGAPSKHQSFIIIIIIVITFPGGTLL